MDSKKWSTATVGFIGIGALAVGLAVPAVNALLLSHKKAEIRATRLLPDNTYECQQWAGNGWGNLSPYKFPPLDSGTFGDKITWRGKDLSGNRARVTVHFANSPFDQPGYPDDVESSTPHPGAGDYPFDVVTLETASGTATCSKFVDPGVHVNQ